MLAALMMWATWETWGNLSIDAGHELYVPAALSRGQTLYRDVWYHYGPAAPYLNGVLFSLFGQRLIVIYLAGSAAAIGSAVFLFLTGCELAFAPQGWVAGAIVIIQAFEPGLFSFPLPVQLCGCVRLPRRLHVPLGFGPIFSITALELGPCGCVHGGAGADAQGRVRRCLLLRLCSLEPSSRADLPIMAGPGA